MRSIVNIGGTPRGFASEPQDSLGPVSKGSVASPARPKRGRETQAETPEAGSYPVAAGLRPSSPPAAKGSPGAAGALSKQDLSADLAQRPSVGGASSSP